MKNKKIQIDVDLEDLLNLKEPSKDSLEYDLLFIMEHGIDKYNEIQQNRQRKKQEFIEMFRECYNDIIKIIEFDPHKRIAVNCYTCLKGMDLSKQYAKPQPKK